MASGSLVSRLLGFARNYLFGMIFVGLTSAVANTFSAANVLPNTIWILVGGGTLNAILVPAIVRAAKQPDRGSDFTSRLLTLLVVASAGLTAVSMLAVPLLLLITNGALPPQTAALATQFGFWLMPQIMFMALYAMLGQLLNAHDSFGPYQWAPALNNLVGIIGAVVFLLIWGPLGEMSAWTMGPVLALAGICVGGAMVQSLFLGFFVRKLGLRLRFAWGFRGLGLGRLGKIGLWTLAMLAIAQVGMWAGRWAVGGAVQEAERLHDQPQLAAQFPGLLSLDWTYLVFMIPQGIIGVALVTAAFPSLSRSAHEGDHTAVMARYAETDRVLAVPMMLATAVIIVLAGPVMWVVSGGVSPLGARANGWVLIGYMLGLVPFAANYLTKRAFYAYEDARAPFLMQLPTSAVPLLAMLPILAFVDPHWAAACVALASSLGSVLGWLFGQHLLRRRAARLGAQMPSRLEAAGVLARLAIAAIGAILVGAVAVHLMGEAMWIHRVLTVVLGGIVGVLMTAVFAGIAWALRVQELRELASRLARRRGASAPVR